MVWCRYTSVPKDVLWVDELAGDEFTGFELERCIYSFSFFLLCDKRGKGRVSTLSVLVKGFRSWFYANVSIIGYQHRSWITSTNTNVRQRARVDSSVLINGIKLFKQKARNIFCLRTSFGIHWSQMTHIYTVTDVIGQCFLFSVYYLDRMCPQSKRHKCDLKSLFCVMLSEPW